MKGINDSNFLQLCNKTIIENLNIKLGKYLLGVHRKSSNLAVMGELGRFPILIKALNHCFTNWQRICDLSPDTIVKKSYIDSLFWNKHSSNTWCGNFLSFLDTFNYTDIWENQNLSIKIPPITKLLQLKYEESLLSTLNSVHQKKLRTDQIFKKSFSLENYILMINLNTRRQFTKLRISSHPLHIETGRYSRPLIPPENRLCSICKNGEVEDETHFLLNCHSYADLRTNLLTHLSEISTYNLNSDNQNLFPLLMSNNNGDYEFATLICNFTKSAFEIHKNILESAQK